MSRAVLAIDPGPLSSGYVLFDGARVICGEPDAENVRLLEMPPWVRIFPELDEEGIYPSDVSVAIEWVTSYGMPVGADVFETCWWAGVLAQAVGEGAWKVARITRRDVKLHLCGSAKAKDSNIRQALIDRFGGFEGKAVAVGTKASPGPLYGVRSHMWAALAVAVTWWDTHAAAT